MNRFGGFLSALSLSAIVLGSAGTAADLVLPERASLTAERLSDLDSFNAPVASFDGKIVPFVTIEGAILRRAWRIEVPGLTSLQVLIPLREQLQQQGYDLIFECDAKECGGFDFRFNTEVLPGPNMYVNISRFRYLTALRGTADAPREAIGVLVSASAESAYVQIITAKNEPKTELSPTPVSNAPIAPVKAPAKPADMATKLMEDGRVILAGLDFATGSSELGPGPYDTLAQLAAVLNEQEGIRIALVGHTDTVGGLGSNIDISKARARSVRQRLLSEYGVDPARLDAEGMGYLAPIAPNLTPEGRRENRRVEAILLNSNE